MDCCTRESKLGRATIGLILPSVDLTTTEEYRTVFPNGINIIETRILLEKTTPESLRKSGEQVLDAAKLLATARPDVISYHCASGAIIKGADYERQLMSNIEKITGIKPNSLALAMVQALQHLQVNKLLVISPYIGEIVEAEEKYLQSFGFNVVKSASFDAVDPLVNMARSPIETCNFTLNAFNSVTDIDAIVISCGALRTITIIDYLEQMTNKPVVSSNTCDIWSCLKLAGISEPVYGYGRLLAQAR